MVNSSTQISVGSLTKVFLKKAFSYKYIYLACIIILVTVALMVNKYSKPVYEVNASILLVQNNSSAILGSNDFLNGIETLQKNKNIDNELSMLTSFSLVSENIANLNLEVGYFRESRGFLNINNIRDIYTASPFTVHFDKSHLQPIDANFYVQILNDSTYKLHAQQDEVSLYNFVDNEIESKSYLFKIDKIYKFNQTVENDSYSFSITLNPKSQQKESSGTKYFFKFYHLDYLAMQFMEALKVEPASPLSSILNVNYRGNNLHKTIAFLNNYLELYLTSNLDKKNKASVNTIQFIDSQISQIFDSLNFAESKLRDYKTENQVTDLSFQGQRIYDQMSQIESERANMEIQKQYYNYIIDYFEKNKDVANVVPPSSMNLVDPFMNQLITDLISLNADRSNIIDANSSKNIFLGQIENKIKLQKDVILENVVNNLNTLNLSINENNYRYNKLSGEISKLPKTEIRMVGIERKFKLNDAIYNFLLQKRSEAEIVRASNNPDYEILSPARAITSNVVFPMRTLNLIAAFFLAFLIPTLYILIKDFFNEKLLNSYEIEKLSGHKVIGEIFRSKHSSEAVVVERQRSSIAESFRKLRTNLLIKPNAGGSSRTILITSSMPFEGKSFISFNLAASFAAIGYKTLLIDFDLRRPVLHKKFKVDNTVGLSQYLLNKVPVGDIIVKTSVPNLYFMPAGPIFPNPSEPTDSGISDKLFNFLKTNFLYIIIDTPPLGGIADSYLLMKYATNTLLITRQNYTRRDNFIEVTKGLETNSLVNYEIVINDVNYKKSIHGSYYSNYYNEEKNNDFDGTPVLPSKKSKVLT